MTAVAAVFLFAAVAGFAAGAAALPEEEALPGRVAERAAESAEKAVFAAVKGVEKAAEDVKNAAFVAVKVAGRAVDGTENAVFSATKEVENESFSAAEDAETPAADVLRAALLDAMACGRLFDSKNGAVSVLFERTSGVDEAETLCAAAYAVFWDAALSHPEDFAHTVPVIAADEVPEGLRLTLTVGSDGELPLETLAAMRFCAYERAAAVARELKRDAAFREGSPSEKARMTALRLAAAAVYDEEGCAVSDTAYGALVLGRATCEGFAGAFDLVCGLLGLEAQAAYDDEHMWNRVTADGDALTVDVTALAAMYAAASGNGKTGAVG